MRAGSDADRRWGKWGRWNCAWSGWAHRDDVFVYVLAKVPAGLAVAAVVIRETGEGVECAVRL